MIKSLAESCKTVRAYVVDKQRNVQSIDPVGEDYIGNVATVLFGSKVSGFFYSDTDPKNASGEYERTVYSSLKQQYYTNVSPLSAGASSIPSSTESRTLHDKITALKLRASVLGDGIVPNTFFAVDNANPLGAYTLMDDGNSNLIVSGTTFSEKSTLSANNSLPSAAFWVTSSGEFYVMDGSERRQVNPRDVQSLRSAGWDVIYVEGTAVTSYDETVQRNHFEIENIGFGYSVCAWYKYLLVGSPHEYKGRDSGYVSMFKYDEVGLSHRLIKNFRYFRAQNALSSEFGHDSSILIQYPANNFMELECQQSSSASFGHAVSVCDGYAIIGSPDFGSDSHGSVFIYDKYKGGTDNWGCINIISSDTVGDSFGYSVAINNEFAVVGAPKGDVAYVFKRVENTDSYNFKFSDESDIEDAIVDEDGVPFTSEESVTVKNAFILDAVLTGSNAGANFGISVAISGKTIAVGEMSSDLTTGNAYVYANVSGSWVLENTLTKNDSFGNLNMTAGQYGDGNNGFGYRVALSSNHLAVSSINDKSINNSDGLTAVYLYKRNVENCDGESIAFFELTEKIFPSIDSSLLVGSSISLTNSMLAIASMTTKALVSVYASGSAHDSGSASCSLYNSPTGTLFGTVDLYDISALTASYVTTLRDVNVGDGAVSRYYGKAVSLTDDFLVVGAPVELMPVTQSGESPDMTLDNIHSFVFTVDNTFPPSGYSGSVVVYDFDDSKKDCLVGNVFYKSGLVTVTNTGSMYQNIFLGTGLAGFSASYKSQHTIHEAEYLVTVNPNEFNYSTHPTAMLVQGTPYGILGNGVVDITDIQLIVKYLRDKNSSEYGVTDDDGIELEGSGFSSDSWWKSQILLLETEDVFLLENAVNGIATGSAMFTTLTNDVTIKIRDTLDSVGYLDVDGDGISTYCDGIIILSYFTNTLTPRMLSSLVQRGATRKTVKEVADFLLPMFGRRKGVISHNFENYALSSSSDPTGSYLSPYITTVGLYDNNELVAIAKLGQPIKTNSPVPLNISIKVDF